VKNFFITGVSSGLGLELCKQLLRRGDYVYGVSRKKPLLQEYLDKGSGDKLIWQYCDVTKFEDINRIIEHQSSIGFYPDVVILNSGVHFNEGGDFIYEDYEKLFKVNCAGALRWVEAFLPVFKNRNSGNFIYISSLAATFPFPFRGSYSSSKVYTSMAFKCLQKQFVNFGINFTVIHAGLLDTKMTSGTKIPQFLKYPVSKGAEIVLQAIESRVSCKYFPLRAVLLEWFLMLLPNRVLFQLLGESLQQSRKTEAEDW